MAGYFIRALALGSIIIVASLAWHLAGENPGRGFQASFSRGFGGSR